MKNEQDNVLVVFSSISRERLLVRYVSENIVAVDEGSIRVVQIAVYVSGDIVAQGVF